MNKNRPTLLIISFSKLISDARILKQIRLFADKYDVVTCGYGPSPDSRVEHVQVVNQIAKQDALLQAAFLRTRQYKNAYWRTTYARDALRKLKQRDFDGVLANDLDTVGVALSLVSGEKIHVDLHEFWPGIHDDVPVWVKLRKPFHEWLLRRWVRQARSVTTVNTVIGDKYLSDYGIQCGEVTNASPYADLEPTPVKAPLRLVHSGGAQPSRKIETMMHAVAQTQAQVTLDMYLVGVGTEYYESVVALADSLGERVRVLPPLPYSELIPKLNEYDAGMQILAPTSTNNALALPNKFFDYVQARLALIIGPTRPMEKILHKYDLGTVTTDFTVEALVRTLDELEDKQIFRWKQNAHLAAPELEVNKQIEGWESPVVDIMNQSEAKP